MQILFHKEQRAPNLCKDASNAMLPERDKSGDDYAQCGTEPGHDARGNGTQRRGRGRGHDAGQIIDYGGSSSTGWCRLKILVNGFLHFNKFLSTVAQTRPLTDPGPENGILNLSDAAPLSTHDGALAAGGYQLGVFCQISGGNSRFPRLSAFPPFFQLLVGHQDVNGVGGDVDQDAVTLLKGW